LFFVISKTIGVMLLPINFLIGIGLLGAVLLATRAAWLGRRLLVASVVLLALCGFSPLGNLLLFPLEQRFPPWDAARGAPDGIIVLGGPVDPDLSFAHHAPAVTSAPDRMITKDLVKPKAGERWLLVTSAFHMPRSVGLFRKVGFAVEPYPVDWRVGGREDLLTFTNVAGDGLARTDTAVREWMGLVAYRLTGRIDELLPGPAED
jgi:uncharacterized SAM-binding protein YcdF (DUF218 family)